MHPGRHGRMIRLALASGRIRTPKISVSALATRQFLSSTSQNLSNQINPSTDQSANALPEIKPTILSRDALLRLHKLSALNPPAEGSEEERELVQGLGELIGLMELVKDVKLEGDVGELLAEGVGEVVIDGSERSGESDQAAAIAGSEKSGKELLDWATRRVGDFYAHRVERKP